MKDFINKINNKEDLTLNEMQEAINLIMSGASDDDDIESYLIGLNETKVRFVKKFGQIKKNISNAAKNFSKEVKNKKYPSKIYSY